MENQNNQILNPTPPVSPVEQAPPVQTPPVLKSKSKLPILIIGIILFLLIVGSSAGFYVFKQQSLKTAVKPTPLPVVQKQTPTPIPDPTANWKTYTNPKYGLSVKYPKELKLTEETEPYGKGELLAQFNYDPIGDECIQIRLAIINIDPSENLSGWIKKEYPSQVYGNRAGPSGGGGPGYTPPPTQIAPYTNYIDKNITGYLVIGREVYIQKNNHLLLFESPGCGPGEDLIDNPKTNAIMEKMIPTFKFTELNNSQLIGPKKRFYDQNDVNNAYSTEAYSKENNSEMISIPDSKLESLSCSPLYSLDGDKYVDKNDYNNVAGFAPLTDSYLIAALKAVQLKYVRKIDPVTYCIKDNGKTIIMYGILSEDRTKNIAYIGLQENNNIIEIAKIPENGTNDLECSKILQLTTDNNLYLECGTAITAGEGMTQKSFYRINLDTKTSNLLLLCTSTFVTDYSNKGPSEKISCKKPL